MATSPSAKKAIADAIASVDAPVVKDEDSDYDDAQEDATAAPPAAQPAGPAASSSAAVTPEAEDISDLLEQALAYEEDNVAEEEIAYSSLAKES